MEVAAYLEPDSPALRRLIEANVAGPVNELLAEKAQVEPVVVHRLDGPSCADDDYVFHVVHQKIQ